MAVCQDCQGTGFLTIRSARQQAGPVTINFRFGHLGKPCPGCNGTGSQSCCEGSVGCAADTTNTGDDDAR